MFCNNCGVKIGQNSRFCNLCGEKNLITKNVEKVPQKKYECQKCGSNNLYDAKFCKTCGSDISIKQNKYAGFWIRFGAWLIDYIGTLFIVVILLTIMAMLGYDTSNISTATDWFISISSIIIYFTFFSAISSTTLGKKIYGLRLIKEDGKNLNWATSLKRAIMQLFSCFFFGVGYINMNKNGKQQAWHDRKNQTFVLKKAGVNYIFPMILSTISLLIFGLIRSSSLIQFIE